MQTVDDFQKLAEEAEQMAKTAASDPNRARWLDLAAQWRALAREAEARVTRKLLDPR
ncbi:MAG TPA: hypothetical protein VGV41_04600 [Pseudolabrys sp.]|uniref:hypothetical protein n=1 Tax=Pseudolabrys sp. TaxID=1960880 RepID=UPI002DDD8181|nr:hypothetical protein [Pseudolabrys sp.]HEV2627904.1 hypothetical protein [Pseudolabrys sp.]